MGTVVKLDSSSRGRAASRARAVAGVQTALVLGGGGFTGGVYEIGALRALDLLSVNRSVNQFDVYVGTSAGALIASLAANGVTPEQMMRVVNNQTPTPFRDINLDMLLRPNYREFVRKGVQLPLQLAGLARVLGRNLGRSRTVDLAIALAEALPSGLYTGSGIEGYVRTVLADPGPHRRLPAARDRAVPGRDRPRHLRAHRARRRGLGRRPDLARRARLGGAADGLQARRGQGPRAGRRRHRLDHEPRHRGRGRRGVHRRGQPARAVRQRLLARRSRRCSARAPAACRTWASRRSPTRRSSCSPTSACTRWRARWKERYPGVDIVLIEPEPDDELMFQTNILNYASRLDVARHGFQSVTVRLANDYDELREVCAAPRHRDLRHARAQGRAPLRRREGEDARLAADPRADDRRAAAPVRGG